MKQRALTAFVVGLCLGCAGPTVSRPERTIETRQPRSCLRWRPELPPECASWRPPARGRPEGVSQEDEDAGRALFYEARDAFLAGNYEAARDGFLESFERARRPGLLYNAALSADRLRHAEEARELLERYVSLLDRCDPRRTDFWWLGSRQERRRCISDALSAGELSL